MNVELQIYSPRWGHKDTYTVEMSQAEMTITMHPRVANCTYVPNQDPVWSGEPLQHIFNNDSIYAPEMFPDLFEWAWGKWRNGEISDQDVDTELQLLATWLNTITAAKPQTDFWRQYF